MEQQAGKESIVSRLFGFGRKRDPEEAATEAGFARTDGEGDEAPSITVPEQVIRIRTSAVRKKDDVVNAIGDSFRELTSLLGSVSDRLDRQDNRAADLAEQVRELPEYLQTLPRLAEQQNEAIRSLGDHVASGNQIARAVADTMTRLPEIGEEQVRAVSSLSERVAESTSAVHGVRDVLGRLPEEIRQQAAAQRQQAEALAFAQRDQAAAQEAAIRKVAAASQQTAKVIHVGNQKSLAAFQQATQKTIQSVQQTAEEQAQQMRSLIDASVSNMKRMFLLAAVFMGVTVAAVVSVLLLR